MKKYILITLTFLIASCGNNLSEKEYIMQNNASTVVADVLFDRDLSEQASYNVRKNGEVIILFTPEVSSSRYTEAVDFLRKHKDVKAVYAEQSGREVCILK